MKLILVDRTSEECAYLAGLIDGEGCLSIYRLTNRTCKRGYTFAGRITVTNTDLDTLVELRELWGIGRVRARTLQPKRKPSYSWEFSPREIKVFLPKIMPYLHIKQRQAKLLMSFLNTQVWGRQRGFSLTDKQYDDRAKMVEDLHTLNRRGLIADINGLSRLGAEDSVTPSLLTMR